jgi:hypothetical protein
MVSEMTKDGKQNMDAHGAKRPIRFYFESDTQIVNPAPVVVGVPKDVAKLAY